MPQLAKFLVSPNRELLATDESGENRPRRTFINMKTTLPQPTRSSIVPVHRTSKPTISSESLNALQAWTLLEKTYGNAGFDGLYTHTDTLCSIDIDKFENIELYTQYLQERSTMHRPRRQGIE